MANIGVYSKPGAKDRYVVFPDNDDFSYLEILCGVLDLDTNRFEYNETNDEFHSLEGEVIVFCCYDFPGEFFTLN